MSLERVEIALAPMNAIGAVAAHPLPTAVFAPATIDLGLIAAPISSEIRLADAPTLLRLETVRLVNPAVAAAVVEVRAPGGGVPRGELGVPIASSEQPSDEQLFEGAADPTQRFYLPRYRIAEIGGLAQARLAADGAGGWAFSLTLSSYPAPALGETWRAAAELAHGLAVVLQHSLTPNSPGAALKELAFDEVTAIEGGVVATLRLPTLTERDLLYGVLTNPNYGAALVVRRIINVGIPAAAASAPQDAPLSAGAATIRGTWTFDFDQGVEGSDESDVWWQFQTSEARLLTPYQEGQLAYLGHIDYDALGPEQLRGLEYSRRPIEAPPSGIGDAVVFVTPNWNPGGQGSTYNNHPIGVWLNTNGSPEYAVNNAALFIRTPWGTHGPDAPELLQSGPPAAPEGSWSVFNQDMAPLPIGACFNVFISRPETLRFVHRCTPDSLSGHCTFVEHGWLQGNPNWLLFVTQNWNPGGQGNTYNSHPFGVWYDGNRWSIFNQDIQALPQNAAFNIWALERGERAFVHTAQPANIAGNYTLIDHPLTNDNPNAMLLITPNWNPGGQGGTYNNHNTGVWYTGSRWSIYNESMAPMPPNAAFNVYVLQPGEGVFVHRADGATINGNFSNFQQTIDLSNKLAPGAVFAVRTGRGNVAKAQVQRYGTDLALRWATFGQAGAPAPQFRAVTRALDDQNERRPFVFPPALNGHIFGSISGGRGQEFKLARRQVKWRDSFASYFQDPVEPHIFYYLPDRFKLARRPEAPHYAMLSVRFGAGETADAEPRATVEYWAFPFVAAARLEAAAQALQGYVPNKQPPHLEPLLVERPRLRLTLPLAGGGAGEQQREDLLIDLRAGFCDTLTMGVSQFQELFDAVLGGASRLFAGSVEVRLPSVEGGVEQIPFEARIVDTVGQLLSFSSMVDEAANSVTLTLRNAVESRLRLKQLAFKLSRGGVPLPAAVQGLALPRVLSPGEELPLLLSAATAPAGGEELHVIVDRSEAELLADDSAAVLDSILRADTPATYQRTISVETLPVVFGGTLQVISVEFAGGRAVNFRRDASPTSYQQQLQVATPIRDLLLRTPDSGMYRFRLHVIDTDGRKLSDAQWRTATTEALWITSDDLPKA